MAADHVAEPGHDVGEAPHPDVLLDLDHVGLAVADLEAAVAFHTEILGWRLDHREDNADQGVSEVMLIPPGAAPGAAQVQLLVPLTPDSAIARFLQRSGPGVQHIAYRVHDIERAAEILRDRGLRLLYDRPRNGTRGSLINFVHPRDTGGILIELVQPAPGEHLDPSVKTSP